MPKELLIPVQRPDGTLLWLSEDVASAIQTKRSARLTVEQYESNIVQAYMSQRLAEQGGRKAKK